MSKKFKDDTKSEDVSAGTVGPGISKVISIALPIALVAMAGQGIISGKYHIGFPSSGDINMMLIMFIALSTLGSIGNIFKTIKDKDPFAAVYSSTFILLIIGSLFIKGLSLWTFLLPFLGVTFVANWITTRTQQAHDIATDKGKKPLVMSEFLDAFGKPTKSYYEFLKGFEEMDNDLDNLEKAKSNLKDALTQEIEVPRTHRVRAIKPSSNWTLNNWRNEKGDEFKAPEGERHISDDAWIEYLQETVDKLKDMPTTAPLAQIDDVIDRMRDIVKKAKKAKGRSDFGKKTIDRYMDVVFDASELFKQSFQFAWEKYKVLVINKPVTLTKEDKNYTGEVYQRFTKQPKVLINIAKTIDVIDDLLESMEKQIAFLRIGDELVKEMRITSVKSGKGKPIITSDVSMKDYLAGTGKIAFTSIGGKNAKFKDITEKVHEILRAYSIQVKRVSVKKYDIDGEDENKIWPNKLRTTAGNERRDKVFREYFSQAQPAGGTTPRPQAFALTG